MLTESTQVRKIMEKKVMLFSRRKLAQRNMFGWRELFYLTQPTQKVRIRVRGKVKAYLLFRLTVELLSEFTWSECPSPGAC